jgi:uncharacterized membrane protein
MADFRKVIVGDAVIAAKYFGKASKILRHLKSLGLSHKAWANHEITIIVKCLGGIDKVIFISGSFVFLYTKSVSFDNIAKIWGWSGGGLRQAFEIDFNNVPNPLTVESIEITEFVGDSGYLNLRTAPNQRNPPLAEYPLNRDGGKITPAPWQPFVYQSSPINFRTVHRGIDRDFMYKTDDLIFVGSDIGAAIHQRLWADETRTITQRYVLPNDPSGYTTFWPAVGMDSGLKYFTVTGNDIYIAATNGVLESYVEIWKLHADMSYFELMLQFHHQYAGGGSERRYGSISTNNIDTEMVFSVSEWNDVDGNPSDLELIYSLDTLSLICSFNGGDYLGHNGRTETGKTRLSWIWRVATDIWAVFIQNTGYGQECNDGFILIDLRDGQVIKSVYNSPNGVGAHTPILNPHRPNLCLVRERERDGAGKERVLMLDVLTGKATVVINGVYNPSSLQFIR